MNWTIIMEQIKELLEEKGYIREDIIHLLSNRNWLNNPPFKTGTFNYDGADFTLPNLCKLFELITGNNASFAEELRKRILSLVPEVEIVERAIA